MIHRLSETWKQQKQGNCSSINYNKSMERKRASKNRSILNKSLLRIPIASSVSNVPVETFVGEQCLLSPAKTMKTCKSSNQTLVSPF